MIAYDHKVRIHRTADEVFDFVAVHQPENHPRWEPEVVEVRRPGPLQVGLKGTMVRREGGKIREVPFEVVDVVAGRKIRFNSGAGGFHLDLTFEMSPTSDGACDFHAHVELTLTGALRLMTPLFAIVFPRKGRRITNRLAEILNAPAAAAA